MDYPVLKEQVQNAPLMHRHELDLLFRRTTIGEAVLPRYAAYLAQATSYREFFDAIYADDSQKDTAVWGLWARYAKKKVVDRFEPVWVREGVKFKGDGFPLELGSGLLLVPTGSRDNVASIYEYDTDGFNHEAVTFFASVGGEFRMAGREFLGVYGIYHSNGKILLEKWMDNEPGDGVTNPMKPSLWMNG